MLDFGDWEAALSANPSARVIRFSTFEVDLQTRELRQRGQKVRLQEQPFQILAALLERPGEVVTREELRARLWPADTFVDFDHSLNAAIKRLRDALGESADTPIFIETLARRGYRFIAPVNRPADGIPIASSGHKVPRAIFYKLAWLALCAGSLAGAAWLYFFHAESAKLPLPRVMPIASLSDRAENAALSPDGNEVAFRRLSNLPEQSGIYLGQIGGEHPLQLTRDPTDQSPVWSPDGRFVAFSRYKGQEHSVYIVSTLGGAERKLYSGAPSFPPLDWSPDNKFIALSGAPPGHSSSSIFLLTLETLETRKLSEPIAGNQDWGPAFSPDGKQLAFVWTNGTLTRGEIFIMSANGSGCRRLTFDDALIPTPPAWTRDGRSIVFSSTRSGLPTLWRIPVAGGLPVQVTQVGVNAFHPTVAHSGHRLAFDQQMGSSILWSLDLARTGHNDTRRQVTASRGRNRAAELSPDGTKIVFVSDRSGSDEIYVCDAADSNLLQVTNLGNARMPGIPRWSPDGQKIAFDAVFEGHTAIFVIQANGGPPRPLNDQASDNLNPSWSRDGSWIYFSSNRSGQWQIWKIRSQGGTALQLTRQGGFAGFESADGRSFYYAKTSSDPDIWRMQLEDGREAAVSPRLQLQQWTGWALADKGVFFVREGPDAHPVLRFLDFATDRVHDVTPLERQPWPLWISASVDGRFVMYQQIDKEVRNIMLLDNFQ